MITEMVEWFKNRTAVPAEAKARVYDFLQDHPGSTVRAIREGAHVQSRLVTDILLLGAESGELTVASGSRGARLYTLSVSGNQSVVPDGNQSDETAVAEPEPVNRVVPEATINCASPVFNLGVALLKPGPKATVPEPSVTVPDNRALLVEESAPTTTESEALPIVDDLRTDLPPRTPEMIAQLLTVENPEQTQRRIANDKLRYALQRARGGPNPQSAIVHDKPSGKTSWVRR